MSYTKTNRPLSWVNEETAYGVDEETIIRLVDRFDYIPDGASSSTYPIIKMTLGETVYEFEKEDVISATLVDEVNPISIELPASVLEFKVFSDDENFSMFSAETQNLLVERFPVLLYEKVDDSQVFLGKYYLSDWKNVSENTFEFEAQNIVGVMGEIVFDGYYWDSATTLEDIFEDILTPVDIDYSLDDSLVAIELSGWIPPGNYRNAVQQICFAAGAYVITSGSSSLMIKPTNLPVMTWDEEIQDSEKTINQSVDLIPLVTGLEIISHDYSNSGVLEDIYEQYLEIGSYKIVFQKPYYDIVVSGPGYVENVLTTEDESFELTTEDEAYTFEAGGEYNFGPNVLYLTLVEAGTVTITGYPWVDSLQSFEWTEDDIVPSTNKNVLVASNATLVNKAGAEDVLERMVDYYRIGYKQKMTIFHYVSLAPQDIIKTDSFFDVTLLGLIRKITYKLTGGFLQEVEIIGIERPI